MPNLSVSFFLGPGTCSSGADLLWGLGSTRKLGTAPQTHGHLCLWETLCHSMSKWPGTPHRSHSVLVPTVTGCVVWFRYLCYSCCFVPDSLEFYPKHGTARCSASLCPQNPGWRRDSARCAIWAELCAWWLLTACSLLGPAVPLTSCGLLIFTAFFSLPSCLFSQQKMAITANSHLDHTLKNLLGHVQPQCLCGLHQASARHAGQLVPVASFHWQWMTQLPSSTVFWSILSKV